MLWDKLSHLDAELALLARQEGALRLRLGQALERLSHGGCYARGFSSLAAYVLERCERSVRWAESARCLARRLEALPALRVALASGALSWSKGEILGGAATPGTESAWLDAAKGCTVRELRALVKAMKPAESGDKHENDRNDDEDEAEARCTLTCTVDHEESWLFEATRQLLEQLGTRGTEDQVEALLAEAQETLLAALPRGAFESPDFAATNEAERSWREQLARHRAEAEVLCEARIRRTEPERNEGAVFGDLPARSAADLDREVRAVCRAMAAHECELSERLLRFHRWDGWRRLGYATESQYARERLGMSRSSLLGRRGLALRLERLPVVAAGLREGLIGVEVALQVVRIATPETEAAWLEHAQRRTVKHLREEVSAALVAVRISGELYCWPPAERAMDAFHELERAVVSGKLGEPHAVEVVTADLDDAHSLDGGAENRTESAAWRVMLASLQRWLAEGVQMSASATVGSVRRTGASAGRVKLELRMSRPLYDWWRALEACARRWLPRSVSWVRFLCLSMWRAHRHLLGADVAYGGIYVRDRYRCTSPVCCRKDVTPHHVQFRSAGGSDDASNMIAVCVWCHLLGIHGGRIRATGSAGHVRWELGRREQPCVVVEGRQRVAA